jgi:CheY-like chemotaxis protein
MGPAAHIHSVLVVDDDPAASAALAELLASDGHKALRARDGCEAIRKLRNGKKPCLLLLDLMMPGMTGWEFLELHRASSRLASIPLVLVTGWTDTDIAQAKAMIPKPLDPRRVLRTLKRILLQEEKRKRGARGRRARKRSKVPRSSAR